MGIRVFSGVQMRNSCLPETGTYGLHREGVDSPEIGKAKTTICRESCFVSTYLLLLLHKNWRWWSGISFIQVLLFTMCVRFLSHAQFASACFEPDLGWCHMQLPGGWQTVSAPQHGALWSPCQADWQVNDTNENQQSLLLGARRWVTASKQPERASLNLKVISLTHSFFFAFSFLALFLLFSIGLPFLCFSLASSHLFTLFASQSYSFSLCGYFLHS